ncbi:MAG TPA: M61 family peptidase [Bacteroidota bacterium]|nr:M61 family peptidase [Bacteroidota bacterium]
MVRTKIHLLFPGVAVLLLLVASTAHPAARRPSTIQLAVDATEAPRMILHTRETISVVPGALTLFYPKWIPGEHAPDGPVTDVAGLRITANGKALPWRRDLEEMYAIHLVVPPSTTELEVRFDFLLPSAEIGFSSGASSTPRMLVLSWNQVLMYPFDVPPDSIVVTASLRLPPGWKHVSALTSERASDENERFPAAALNTLIDSPVLCGEYLKRVDLTPPNGVPHFLDLASDNEAALAITPEEISSYRQLVVEALGLFGCRHYDHYDFLFTLSDEVAHFGLEHHQCSDDRVPERTLVDDDFRRARAGLLPHEFVHSWNGKFRRPVGLATGNFSSPMKDDLLWVYEGLTEYLGAVLTGRSGLLTPEEQRDDLALVAAKLDHRPGRTWRPLQDANDEAQLLYSARTEWDSWRRDVDFYDEGYLIWLEADVTIRELTNGKKSLDDFCRAFHGGGNSGPELKPYSFEDVVRGMNNVAPYDWRTFFVTRLQSTDDHAPLGGIIKSGWKLVYRDTMNDLQKSVEEARKTVDMRYSLGLLLGDDGTMKDVIPGMPAARSGLAPGMKIIAVNGRRYSKEILRDALKLAVHSTSPLSILAENGEFYETYSLDYHQGERYPYLERDAAKPDVLSMIMHPGARP